MNQIALTAQNWIQEIFNKEGLAIFVLFCVSIFAIATIAVIWAIDNGEFKNIEEAKYEMMEC
jgi:nitrogen fixation-related uncharacterized protein